MTLRISSWTLAAIADAVDGRLTRESDATVQGVSTDSRTIGAGSLFVALSGENFDAHDFVQQAGDDGALAAIVGRELDVDIPQIVVDDTLVALQRLGRALFDEATREGLFSIALTGSNGKTTTKEILAALWSIKGNVHATKGNLNNHIGVPLTLCALPLEADVAVIEMGANRIGDIEELIALAPADIRVITSIGAAHIEGFGGLEGVRQAKSEIFDDRDRRPSLAVIPASEEFETGTKTLRVGGEKSGADVVWTREDAGVRVVGSNFDDHLKFSLPGAHNAQNLATAVATFHGAGRGFNANAANLALADLSIPGGRWREVKHGDWTFLDDAYNANPDSVRASWAAFTEIRRVAEPVVPTVAIIGEMFELGDLAEPMHQDTARFVVEKGGADHYAFVGRYADAMAEEASAATETPVRAFPDVASAGAWLVDLGPARVYLKASRGQRLESLIDHVIDTVS